VAFFQRRNPSQPSTPSQPDEKPNHTLSRHDFIAAVTAGLGALVVSHAFRDRDALKRQIGDPRSDPPGKGLNLQERHEAVSTSPNTAHASTRKFVSPTAPSQEAISLIKSFEEYRSQAYLCPAGQPTIGYGHTKGVELGDTLKGESEAVRLLHQDLQGHTKSVLRVFQGIHLTQTQLDALTSADFNASCLKNGATGFAQYARSVFPELNATRDPNRRLHLQRKLVSYLCRYNRVDGEIFDGLLRRRLSEGLLLAGSPRPIISTDEYNKLKQDACARLKTKNPSSHRLIREMVSRSFASRGLSKR
jgi:lysozyme